MRLPNYKLSRLLLPVMMGAGCMIALLSAMNAFADWKNQAPRIGDLIAFDPARDVLSAPAPRMIVDTAGGGHCVLDARTLRRLGGSFLVSGRLADADRRYLVHWAGAQTAEGAATCADNADLKLDARQIDSLTEAAAAGGLRRTAGETTVNSSGERTSRPESRG